MNMLGRDLAGADKRLHIWRGRERWEVRVRGCRDQVRQGLENHVESFRFHPKTNQ